MHDLWLYKGRLATSLTTILTFVRSSIASPAK